jgi:hypothetical protein
VLVAAVAPYSDDRRAMCVLLEDGGFRFHEVHVSTPLDVCIDRDVKGLYTRHRRGEISQLTGVEYLESLRNGREVWIYGERVRDVTEHPAFATSARQLARLYDALHRPGAPTVPTDTGTDGFTHPFFRTPHTRRPAQECRRDRRGVPDDHGWMGRSPDYTASITATFGASPELFEPF